MVAFVGEIRLFPYEFVPKGWLQCDGSARNTRQYQELFTVLGYQYGGSQESFNLPDLNSQVAMGMGKGPQCTLRKLGDGAGADVVALESVHFAPHRHKLKAQPGDDYANTQDKPGNKFFLAQPRLRRLYNSSAGNADFILSQLTIKPEGSNLGSFERPVMQPYLALVYCICVDGIYPVQG